MKRIFYTISILLITCGAFAQDLTDALRYSNYHISGTARSTAMGNAFGALGGDFSSLSINPAGAAVYRSSEFTITPSFGKTDVDGTYLGNKASDSKYNIGLNNLGYIATFNTNEINESGLVSISVGLGLNKLGSFSLNSLAEGSNAKSSLLGYFTNNANDPNVGFNNYYEQLAWDTYLINRDAVSTSGTPNTWSEGPTGDQEVRSRSIPTTVNNQGYFNDITDNGYGQSVRKAIDQRGYIDEYVLTVAANFNHKLYIGATLGIQDVYFRENSNIYEWDAKNNIPYFNNFNYNTYLKTTGNGFNFKIGAIYKPIDQLRLGIAFHTPTFYKFNDLYDSGMSSSITYDDGATKNYSSYPDKEGTYDYEIETPMRTILSGAYIIGKSALISVDYEIVDYSTSKIKNGSDGYDFYGENKSISNAYKTIGNLHLGGEYRINNNFSLRAGYENYPSVYQKTYLNALNLNDDSKYSTVSCGFGVKQGNVFFDAAFKRIMIKDYAKFYPDANADEMIKNNTSENSVIFTLGYKF
jgi:hypothetical protein